MDVTHSKDPIRNFYIVLLVGFFASLASMGWLHIRTNAVLKETPTATVVKSFRTTDLRMADNFIQKFLASLEQRAKSVSKMSEDEVSTLRTQRNLAREATQSILTALAKRISTDFIETPKASWKNLDSQIEKTFSSIILEEDLSKQKSAAKIGLGELKSAYAQALDATESSIERQSLRGMTRIEEVVATQSKVLALLLTLMGGVMFLGKRIQNAQNLLLVQDKALSETAKQNIIGSMAGAIAYEMTEPISQVKEACKLIDEELRKPETDRANALTQVAILLLCSQKFGKFQKELSGTLDSIGEDSKTNIPFSQIAHNISTVFESKIKRNGIRLAFTPGSENCEVFGNGQVISRILGLLIAMSVERLENAEERAITISAKQSGNFIQIAVQDTFQGHQSPEMEFAPASFTKVNEEVQHAHVFELRKLVTSVGGKLMASKAAAAKHYAFTVPAGQNTTSKKAA